MKKKTAKEIVAENLESLKNHNHAELTAWGKMNGFDSRAGFSAYKKALLTSGIDYDAMKAEKRAAKQAAAEATAVHEIMLYTDAKARTDRFAICNKNGDPVWYGKFFDDDRDYSGEQSTGEMAAAKKAVWLASKVKDVLGASTIRLTLMVDAEWLTWANLVQQGRDGGGKARALGEAATKAGVVLTVQHIPGAENPADKYTICTGFQKYDIESLVLQFAA